MSVKLKKNYSLISSILPKGKASEIIKNAVPDLVGHAVVLPARGMLVKEKWIQRFLPAMSPEYAIVDLLVPDKWVKPVMGRIIQEGHLHHSGAGGIYCIPCQSAYSTNAIEKKINIKKATQESFQINEDLIAIFCIVQKGKSENIAAAAMHEGSPGPAIGYGEGHGIRDKMGIWKFAINPEKELLRVVVDSYDFEAVFNAMIEAGNLKTPGMGFIYAIPASAGLMNISSVVGGKSQLASNRQIIKAIDDLKRGTQWRSQVFSKAKSNKKRAGQSTSSDQLRLTFIVDQAYAEIFIEGALSAGAPGLSVNYGREFLDENLQSNIQKRKDLVVIEMNLAVRSQDKIISFLVHLAKEENVRDYKFFVQSVPTTLIIPS